MSTHDTSVHGVSAADIVEGLRRLGVGEGARLFVHTSLSAFGHVGGGAATVCAALLETAGPTGAVAVPTFTWGANHDKETVVFDVAADPCDVGAVPETFRRLPGARRSDHLCHSVSALGPLAPELMGDGIHPFGRGSSLHALYELDFLYVFLGCGFAACTALHTVEELAQVPYRYYRHYRGSTVIRANGERVGSRALEYLRYQPFQNDFAAMERIYRERGVLREGRIGEAAVMVTTTRAIVGIGLELVSRDPGALLTLASREYLTGWEGPGGSQ